MKKEEKQMAVCAVIAICLAVVLFAAILIPQFFGKKTFAAENKFDWTRQLKEYDVVWNKQSKNVSESMPLGGGNLGLNVWVENNELLFYIGSPDTLDENMMLDKFGRVRISMDPCPFSDDGEFLQKLNLLTGDMTIAASNDKNSVEAELWVDVYRNVVNVSLQATKPTKIKVSYENWRTEDNKIQVPAYEENFMQGQRYVFRDNFLVRGENRNQLLFYHKNRNDSLAFDALVEQQGLTEIADQLVNPQINMFFGGILEGTGLRFEETTTEGIYGTTEYTAWEMTTDTPLTKTDLRISTIVGQYQSEDDFIESLDEVRFESVNDDSAREKTRAWWLEFWNRSYVALNVSDKDPSDEIYQAGKNYALTRYMQGCAAFCKLPVKFNGAMFTYDPCFIECSPEDTPFFSDGVDGTPDMRYWGGIPGSTLQNQRIISWPLLRNGDFDLVKPQFDYFSDYAQNAQARSQYYWGHDGVCFDEWSAFGLAAGGIYGWNRTSNDEPGIVASPCKYQYNNQLEFAFMMLQAYRYGNIDLTEYLPFIQSAVKFFYEHYQYRNRQETGQNFDSAGKLVIRPSTAMETFKNATNPTDVVVALHCIVDGVLQLPSQYENLIDRAMMTEIRSHLPEIKYSNANGKTTISIADQYTGKENFELPELAAVWPYGYFHLGNNNFSVALNTWNAIPDELGDPLGRKGGEDWESAGVIAARLGLKEEAAFFALHKLSDSDKSRFPVFHQPYFDWEPNNEHAASGMNMIQEMIVQDYGNDVFLFPSTPDDWEVNAKLLAGLGTQLEVSRNANGKITYLKLLQQTDQRESVTLHCAEIGSEKVEVINGKGESIPVTKGEDTITFRVEQGEEYYITEIPEPFNGQPTGVRAESDTVEGNEVFVGWDAVPGAAKYRVYRKSVQTGESACIAEVEGTSYVDRVVFEPGDTAIYAVSAVHSDGAEGKLSAWTVILANAWSEKASIAEVASSGTNTDILLDLNHDFILKATVTPEAFGKDGVYLRLFDCYSSRGFLLDYREIEQDGIRYGEARFIGNGESGVIWPAFSANRLEIGVSTEVVLSYNAKSQSMSLLYDGALISEWSVVGLLSPDTTLRVGQNISAGDQFAGKIADFFCLVPEEDTELVPLANLAFKADTVDLSQGGTNTGIWLNPENSFSFQAEILPTEFNYYRIFDCSDNDTKSGFLIDLDGNGDIRILGGGGAPWINCRGGFSLNKSAEFTLNYDAVNHWLTLLKDGQEFYSSEFRFEEAKVPLWIGSTPQNGEIFRGSMKEVVLRMDGVYASIVRPTRIEVELDSDTMTVGEEAELKIYAIFPDGRRVDVTDQPFELEVTVPGTAIPLQGKCALFGLGTGQTDIIVSSVWAGYEYKTLTTISVEPDKEIERIFFEQGNFNDPVGGITGRARLVGVDKENRAYDLTALATYESSNPNVAVLADSGYVIALGSGEAVITATVDIQGKTLEQDLKVSVNWENHFSLDCVNNNGIEVNDVTYCETDGKMSALFGSQGSITIPSADSVDFTDNFLLSADFYATAYSPFYYRLFDKKVEDTVTYRGFFLDVQPDGYLRILYEGRLENLSWKLPLNVWVNVGIGYDSHNRTLYVLADQKVVASISSATVKNVENSLKIGADQYGTSNFIGSVCNVSCSNASVTLSDFAVQRIELNNGKDIVLKSDGETAQIVSNVYPQTAKNKKVIYTATDLQGQSTMGISVNSDGLVRAHCNGEYLIRADATDGSGVSTTIQVSVSGQKLRETIATLDPKDYASSGFRKTDGAGWTTSGNKVVLSQNGSYDSAIYYEEKVTDLQLYADIKFLTDDADGEGFLGFKLFSKEPNNPMDHSGFFVGIEAKGRIFVYLQDRGELSGGVAIYAENFQLSEQFRFFVKVLDGRLIAGVDDIVWLDYEVSSLTSEPGYAGIYAGYVPMEFENLTVIHFEDVLSAERAEAKQEILQYRADDSYTAQAQEAYEEILRVCLDKIENAVTKEEIQEALLQAKQMIDELEREEEKDETKPQTPSDNDGDSQQNEQEGGCNSSVFGLPIGVAAFGIIIFVGCFVKVKKFED